jgi:anaerobic magnesium-protoporphyrin IX monomethyl ester cyclase
MKLLLIYPPQKHFYLGSIKSSIFAEEAGAYTPLGLLSIATCVLDSTKHDVKVVDSIAEDLDYPDIEAVIAKEAPDIVGVTCITDYLIDAVMVAKTAKKVNPAALVMFGGHHVNLFPIETIRLPYVDIAVMGDGELVVKEILDRLSDNKSIDELNGVLTKTNFDKRTPQRIVLESLDALPLARRDLVNYDKYTSVLAKGSPVTTMLTSRGCPFSCPYCSGGNIKMRSNSTARVIEEIESCLKLGINDILFFDELFTMNKKRVVEICDMIIEKGLRFRWHARARIDCVDRELLKKMKKAGCRLIQFGIEAGTDRIQKVLKRNLTIEKIREVIKITQGTGILTYGNFMFNAPTETREEMQATIDFAIALDLDYAVFGALTVFPKTELYAQLKSEGRLKEDFWQRFVEAPETYRVSGAFWPGEYGDAELNAMVEKAYRAFYIRPRYLVKALFRNETLKQKLTQIRSGINVLLRLSK